MRPIRVCLIYALSLYILSMSCAHLHGPPTGEVEIVPVALGTLPLEARFVPVGSIGTAYKLEGGTATEVRFPMEEGALDSILPATVRLFQLDEKTGRWKEIAKSRYAEESRNLVGANLGPGIYTAFGWSANPVENALQRILLDASLGYGGLTEPPNLGPGAEQGGNQSIAAFRRDLLRIWLDVSFSYPITSCQTRDDDDCPMACQRAAGREILSACRVNGVECEQPQCCDCVTGSFTERLVIPRSIFDTLPIPCGGAPSGVLCPVCPNGLSCPQGPFTEMTRINPVMEAPDYAVLDEIGLGVVTEDLVLRDRFHEMVEWVTGNEYPVPPPWP